MERKDIEHAQVEGRPKPEGLDPTAPRRIALECFPTLQGTTPLKHFLEHVKGFSNPSKENTTTIYHATGGKTGWDNSIDFNWSLGATRPARSLASVALESSKKDAVVKDITYYLTPECKRFYAIRGYPYRRGFLLYGPPGTGKTSFSVALAGHFDLDVYILSMSDKSMSDQQLEILFSNLPDKCIVLLEDVDSAGLNREISKAELKRMWRNNDQQQYVNFDRFAEEHKSGLTLSGLLNCIDGPMSRDGRIICLTSNAPDSLDPALVRPGRCDHKVLFGYVSEEICTQLFEHLYTKRPDELIEGETSISDEHDIQAMARKFAKAIPPGSMISPAEIQGYLMIHLQEPQAALDGVSAFAAEIIETKKRGANVAKHANEVDRVNRAKMVTWGAADSVAASEDGTGESDHSEEGDDCSCCTGSECGCAEDDCESDANVKGASSKKRKSSSVEEPGRGSLSQVFGGVDFLLRVLV